MYGNYNNDYGGTSNSISLSFFIPLSSSSFLQSGFHSGTGQITKSQVLSELQFTLGQKERAVLSNPYDTTSQNHIAVLHQVHLTFLKSCKSPYVYLSQLRKLVEAGVSQNELRQILTQLRNMVKNSTPAPVPQPTLPPVHNWSPQPPFPPHFPQGVSLPQAYPQVDSAASTAANVTVVVSSICKSSNVSYRIIVLLNDFLRLDYVYGNYDDERPQLFFDCHIAMWAWGYFRLV